MCIRDSIPIVSVLLGTLVLGEHLSWSAVAGFVVVLGAALAVSYTHLRAHETVLDLVCRLLLEKKKEMRCLVPKLIHVSHRLKVVRLTVSH